jgi:hypothetical protein
MKTSIENKHATTVAARVAGEDIKPGDYVTVLSEVVELPSYLWCCSDVALPPEEPVRGRYIPREAGEPFKVVAICLPFVYTKHPTGSTSTFDLRRTQLARLDQRIGGAVWKQLRTPLKPRKKIRGKQQ